VKLSFLECYQILDINDDCDWPTLRKKYKTLIQRSHPDRFEAGSAEQQSAQSLIRSYNAAYKQIADFYQANQKLPPSLADKSDENIIAPKPRKKRPSVNHEHIRVRKKSSSYNTPVKFIFISALIFVSYFISFYFNDNVSEQKKLSTSVKPEILPEHHLHNQRNIEHKPIATHPTQEKYFTTGSGLGEVITTQGQPTRVEGNIWYYGESSVTFTDGAVSSWFRHPQFPLKVKITENSGFTYRSRSDTEEKPEKTHQPYWKR